MFIVQATGEQLQLRGKVRKNNERTIPSSFPSLKKTKKKLFWSQIF
jgi:hypothetical protein